jgi:hypothetical protein
MSRLLPLLVICVLGVTSASAGQVPVESARSTQDKPGDCETNASNLNSVAQDELKGDGVVIAIARLGAGETSRTHNRERLLAVRYGLVKSGLPADRIVLAEGSKVTGYGVVELYVAGKLHTVILASRNKGLCVQCCDGYVGHQ